MIWNIFNKKECLILYSFSHIKQIIILYRNYCSENHLTTYQFSIRMLLYASGFCVIMGIFPFCKFNWLIMSRYIWIIISSIFHHNLWCYTQTKILPVILGLLIFIRAYAFIIVCKIEYLSLTAPVDCFDEFEV